MNFVDAIEKLGQSGVAAVIQPGGAIKDKEIIIIDEQTGRQLPGRRYGDGLHQSLEAK